MFFPRYRLPLPPALMFYTSIFINISSNETILDLWIASKINIVALIRFGPIIVLLGPIQF